MTERIVTCMKWGSTYGAVDVNLLHRGVARQLTDPFRFVCITDDAAGLAPGIATVDLAALRAELPAERIARGKWQKLTMFRRGLFPDDARVLFLDLDSVVVRPLEPFFAMLAAAGGLHLCFHDAERALAPPPHRFGNSSIVGFIPGEQHHIYDRFIAEGPAPPVRKEQEFESLHGHNARHWPREWVAVFKSDCARPFPASLLSRPQLPPTARVVIFPGAIKPRDLARGGLYVWGTPARFGVGDVPWVAAYCRGEPPAAGPGADAAAAGGRTGGTPIGGAGRLPTA
jgi:hypothetical protein